MIAQLYSSTVFGVEAFRVTVEVSLSGKGIGTLLTGLPDDAIKESLGRIDTAIQLCGYHMPRTKLVINLVPADVRKMGTAFDLPIALGILMASGQLHDLGKLKDYIIAGEMGLDGSIHPVRGTLSMAVLAKRQQFKGILIPQANTTEASLVNGVTVYGIRHIKDLVEFIKTDLALLPSKPRKFPLANISPELDFKDVKGQYKVKRALEVAAAGGHNTIIIGPPGIGKTMLAKRLPGILPPLTIKEALETTQIYSVSRNVEPICSLHSERPFRNPHHTISDVGLAGGGSIPFPGEISLAHNGVLFLDELPEFKRSVIEVLRQPLEERKILIARAKMSLEFPAAFMLLASMNACPCGYYGHPERKCTCSSRAVWWYRRKISGPLLDRIDLQVEAEPTPFRELMELNEPCDSSIIIRQRVIHARKIQLQRFKNVAGIHCNAQIPDHLLNAFCKTESHAIKFLLKSMDQYDLSFRAYSHILKVSRTIADLAGTEHIEINHIAEAIHFRSLDKPLLINFQGKQKKFIKPILHANYQI